MKAIWNNTVIAESDQTLVIEGNHYFPPESVNYECLQDSDHSSHCHWKGRASYYHVVVDGKTNKNAAWYYPVPKEKASQIKNHIAFWNGVEVVQ